MRNRTNNISKINIFSVILTVLSLLFLTGCTTSFDFTGVKEMEYPQKESFEETPKEGEEVFHVEDGIEPRGKDPNQMIEYLKNRKISEEPDEEAKEEWDLSREVVFISNRGYDKSAVPMGVKFVDGIYELTKLDSAYIPAECKIAYSNLIKDRLNEIVALAGDIDTMDATMYLADMLLCLEYYSDSPATHDIKKAAVVLAEKVIGDVSQDKIYKKLSDADKYNLCAVLCGCASFLSENEMIEKDSANLSYMIWDELSDKDVKATASKFWAAAELFASTGEAEYKSVCEDIAKEEVPTGFTMESPGYYGCFSYMHSNYKSDIAISEKIMAEVFLDANENITKPLDDMINEVTVDDFSDETQNRLCEEDMKYIEDMIDTGRLEMLVNYVSTSVEYIRYAENRLNFIYGANHTGCDYSDKELFDNEVADTFILCALLQNSLN